MTTTSEGPPDGGWGWLCAVGKLYCYFITTGLTSAFGVVYVELIDYFNSTREETAWIGSLSLGLTLLTGPLSSVFTSRFGIQKTTAAGTLIAFSGCFISCFANGTSYLYVSYGVVMGLGLGFILVPCILIVLQYFKGRLGLANAIGSTGSGIGILVLPPIYTYLLEHYGWRGTLMLQSGIILNGLVCAFIFIPPSYLKASRSHASSETTKFNFCRNLKEILCKPCTILYLTGGMIGTFGYSIPFLHLPDMTIQIGIDKYQAASLISTMGVAGIIGRIVFGFITDNPCVNVILLQGLSLLICGAATAVCPHLTEFYALAVYSVIHGAFLGVFVSILPLVGLKLVGFHCAGDLMGVAFFLSGVMNAIASPVAGWLFDFTKTYNASFYVASSVFFLGGMFIILSSVLHRRTVRLNTGNNDTNVSKAHVSAQQCNVTQEETHL